MKTRKAQLIENLETLKKKLPSLIPKSFKPVLPEGWVMPTITDFDDKYQQEKILNPMNRLIDECIAILNTARWRPVLTINRTRDKLFNIVNLAEKHGMEFKLENSSRDAEEKTPGELAEYLFEGKAFRKELEEELDKLYQPSGSPVPDRSSCSPAPEMKAATPPAGPEMKAATPPAVDAKDKCSVNLITELLDAQLAENPVHQADIPQRPQAPNFDAKADSAPPPLRLTIRKPSPQQASSVNLTTELLESQLAGNPVPTQSWVHMKFHHVKKKSVKAGAVNPFRREYQ